MFFVWLLTGLLNNESWLTIRGTELLSYWEFGSQNNQFLAGLLYRNWNPLKVFASAKQKCSKEFHFNKPWWKPINMMSLYWQQSVVQSCAAAFRLETKARAFQLVWVWVLLTLWLLSKLKSEVRKQDVQNTHHPSTVNTQRLSDLCRMAALVTWGLDSL